MILGLSYCTVDFVSLVNVLGIVILLCRVCQSGRCSWDCHTVLQSLSQSGQCSWDCHAALPVAVWLMFLGLSYSSRQDFQYRLCKLCWFLNREEKESPATQLVSSKWERKALHHNPLKMLRWHWVGKQAPHQPHLYRWKPFSRLRQLNVTASDLRAKE